MKDWYMVLISDLKAHLRSNSFLLLNLLALSFLALITTVFWPSGIIVQFERPCWAPPLPMPCSRLRSPLTY